VSAAQTLYPMTEVGSGAAIATANEELQRHHREVADLAAGTLTAAGFEATAEVPRGDPRDMLVAFARDRAADLVVVGSHGKGRLERLLLGSVTNYVVAHAPCSVLVVKTRDGKKSAA
jgi:nucleotide-binding universal stress UspA family protein